MSYSTSGGVTRAAAQRCVQRCPQGTRLRASRGGRNVCGPPSPPALCTLICSTRSGSRAARYALVAAAASRLTQGYPTSCRRCRQSSIALVVTDMARKSLIHMYIAVS